MKTKFAILLAALALSGCATSEQRAEYSEIYRPDGTREVHRDSHARGRALGNARNAIDAQRITNTDKTSGIGVTGSEQKAEGAELIQALTKFAEAMRPTPK